MHTKKKHQKGFTLIELLVVISIIGTLSSIVMASLQSARSKARDAVRIASFKQLRTALDLYYDTTGHYPITPSGWVADCWQASSWIPDGSNYGWNAGYIAVQPRDPVDYCDWPWTSTPGAGTYAYYSDGTYFGLVTRLENASPYNIQNQNTKWVDGNSLYTNYTWNGKDYAIVVK